MRNSIYLNLSSMGRLFAFLLFLTTSHFATAQLVVDDCNTGAFLQQGNGAQHVTATGAIGGSRDVSISNAGGASSYMAQFASTSYIRVNPSYNGSNPTGNFDIGWGNSYVAGGNDLNLNAANYSRIELRLTAAPFNTGQLAVRFNKPGDSDYSSAAVNIHGQAPLTYTFQLSNFSGLNPNDIDGISIGFINCDPDSISQIDYVQFAGFADSDGDGIGNGSDNCPNVANANQANSDGDALGDACDACPLDANNDVDGDGVCGNVDNCPTVANANQLNTDGDGQGNACDPDDDNDGIADGSDNCPLNSNANQLDTDGDGLGNVCDPDDDNDGVVDGSDNCPLVANPSQTNTDGDGLGDACDPDDDNDGVADASDNCPSTPAGQGVNTSGCSCSQVTVDDGNPCTLDACTNGVVTHTLLDADGDGVCNLNDNCPNVANADQLDSDGDGMGDACDACDYALPNIPNFNNSTCNCEAGYYQVTTTNGETVIITGCQTCPPGYFCPDGVNGYPCPAGSYNDLSGQTACASCPAGTSNPNVGQTSCAACPPGSYSSTTGNTVCASCPAGTSNPNSGQTACAACPPGSFSSTTGNTVCASCPAGTSNSLSGQTHCVDCPPGKFSSVTGSVVCESCPAGTSNPLSGQTHCVDCPPGKFSSTIGNVECQNCPAGTSNPNSGQTACAACPPGSYSSTVGNVACASCPAGTSNPNSGQTACVACPPGQYSSTTGNVQCQNCPAGTYNPYAGQTACLGCPAGTNSIPGSIECVVGDTDGDGIIDANDNCPAIANSNQSDADADGIGDACDASLNIGAWFSVTANYIQGLNISGGNKNALIGKLQDAMERYCNGHTSQALSKLNAFINQVQSLVASNVLTQEQVNYLIAQAQALINAINAGTVQCPGQNIFAPTGNGGIQTANGMELLLFPNPTDGKVAVQLTGMADGEAQLTVLDRLGRVVLAQKIEEGTEQLELDFSKKDFAAGDYFVRVISNSGILTGKLMISK